MKKKFDYMMFSDDETDFLVFNYNKYNNNIEMIRIIEEEHGIKDYNIVVENAKYYPRHDFFENEGGYILVDKPIKGSFKVIAVREENSEWFSDHMNKILKEVVDK